MNEQDRQLVESIVQTVIAQLAQRGAISADADPRADIQPPIGACTGDYSQFPELTGRQVSATPPGNVSPPTTTHPIALTGIVTASQLQGAMDTSADGIAYLAPDARLSPLANDMARRVPDRIQRTGVDQPSSRAAGAGPPSQWLWWLDGHNAAVRDLGSRFARNLVPFGAGYSAPSMSSVVRELAGAIAARRAAGGFLFVQSAAKAICLANRCRSVRAIVATCSDAVEQGIVEMGANVLVIEYPHVTPGAMAMMVERMLQQAPTVSPAVERELADLHRCE